MSSMISQMLEKEQKDADDRAALGHSLGRICIGAEHSTGLKKTRIEAIRVWLTVRRQRVAVLCSTAYSVQVCEEVSRSRALCA